MFSRNIIKYFQRASSANKQYLLVESKLRCVRFKSTPASQDEFDDESESLEEVLKKLERVADISTRQRHRRDDFQDADRGSFSRDRGGFGGDRGGFGGDRGGFGGGRGGFGGDRGSFGGDRGGFGGDRGGFGGDRGGFGGGRGGFSDMEDSGRFSKGRHRAFRGAGGFGGDGGFGGAREEGFSGLGNSLQTPNWDALAEFQKNFYVEHPDVTSRSEEEIKAYRNAKDMVIDSGSTDVPRPVQTFEEAGFPGYISDEIRKLDWGDPSPIQAQGWPIVLSGRDVVGIASTGSGKTAAFILPAIVHIMNQPKTQPGQPICLVLTPTRELCQQVCEVSRQFAGPCKIRTCAAFGGASRPGQIRDILRGSEIMVCTPGRLIDFLESDTINLERVTYLVLDEADRMLDMGFEPSIRKILSQVRPDRQTVMWSATWPREVHHIARDFMQDYVKLTMGSDELIANPRITQHVRLCRTFEKEGELRNILDEIEAHENRKTLIFTRTKAAADMLYHRMRNDRYPVGVIHGDKNQGQRDSAMQAFRSGRVEILVATDVAARGLDVSDIAFVINYDFPNQIEDYIHRIGRTARGERSGTAYALFTTQDTPAVAQRLVKVLRQANQQIPEDLWRYSTSVRRSPHRR